MIVGVRGAARSVLESDNLIRVWVDPVSQQAVPEKEEVLFAKAAFLITVEGKEKIELFRGHRQSLVVEPPGGAL